MLHWLIVATIHHSCRSWSMHQKALLPSLSGFPHLWGCKRRIQNNLFSVVDECSKSVLKKYVKQPCTNYNRLTVTVLSWALTPFLYSVCLGGLLFDVHPHCCHYCCWVFPSSLFHWQQYLTNKHIIGDCLASFLTHLTHKQFTWNKIKPAPWLHPTHAHHFSYSKWDNWIPTWLHMTCALWKITPFPYLNQELLDKLDGT